MSKCGWLVGLFLDYCVVEYSLQQIGLHLYVNLHIGNKPTNCGHCGEKRVDPQTHGGIITYILL